MRVSPETLLSLGDTVLKSNGRLIIFSSRLKPREPLRCENYQSFDLIENSMIYSEIFSRRAWKWRKTGGSQVMR